MMEKGVVGGGRGSQKMGAKKIRGNYTNSGSSNEGVSSSWIGL